MNTIERERALRDVAFRYLHGDIDLAEHDRMRREIEREFRITVQTVTQPARRWGRRAS